MRADPEKEEHLIRPVRYSHYRGMPWEWITGGITKYPLD